MARAIWTGSISFGLVNIPVKVYPAVRDHKVHFHQLDRGSGSRIRYEKVSEKSGREVAAKDIELGYEMAKGKLVVVDPSELDELRPRTTRTIDITDFVELAEVDPAFYNRTYWLGPDGDAAVRAYSLLHTAMEEQGRVGIGMVVMRNRQYLAAIRPREGALAMSTMRFADEVLGREDIDGLPPRRSKPDAKELRLATQIVDSLAGPWRPDQYRDTYTDEVKKLVQAREKGRNIVVEDAPAARAEPADLMQALQASLDAARAKSGRADRAKALDRAADQLAEVQAAQAGSADEAGDSREPGQSKRSSRRRPARRPQKAPGTKKPARTSSAGSSRSGTGAKDTGRR